MLKHNVWACCNFVIVTRTPPVEVHRPIVTYLQFQIQVGFSILSMFRPRPASHTHFRHWHPYGLNSSIDYSIMNDQENVRELLYSEFFNPANPAINTARAAFDRICWKQLDSRPAGARAKIQAEVHHIIRTCGGGIAA